jgi:hypothetical protein
LNPLDVKRRNDKVEQESKLEETMSNQSKKFQIIYTEAQPGQQKYVANKTYSFNKVVTVHPVAGNKYEECYRFLPKEGNNVARDLNRGARLAGSTERFRVATIDANTLSKHRNPVKAVRQTDDMFYVIRSNRNKVPVYLRNKAWGHSTMEATFLKKEALLLGKKEATHMTSSINRSIRLLGSTNGDWHVVDTREQ